MICFWNVVYVPLVYLFFDYLFSIDDAQYFGSKLKAKVGGFYERPLGGDIDEIADCDHLKNHYMPIKLFMNNMA